jgi:hypothetical protein
LEVQPVCRAARSDDFHIVDDDADADFFALYGRDEAGFAHAIGDFADRQGAEIIKAALEDG